MTLTTPGKEAAEAAQAAHFETMMRSDDAHRRCMGKVAAALMPPFGAALLEIMAEGHESADLLDGVAYGLAACAAQASLSFGATARSEDEVAQTMSLQEAADRLMCLLADRVHTGGHLMIGHSVGNSVVLHLDPDTMTVSDVE